MNRTLSVLCMLTLTLLVVGCGQEDPLQPAGIQSTTQESDLSQGNAETTTPQFHTIYWPPPAYSSAVMTLNNNNNGEGSHVVTLQEMQAPCFSQLIRVDLSTGAVQPIGPVHGINFAGPEFDAYGNLYATGFTAGPPEGRPSIFA